MIIFVPVINKTIHIMKALTLNDLAKWCNTAIKEGHGEKTIIVAGDDEGNYFRCIYEGLSLVGDLFEGKYAPDLYGMKASEAKDNALILY